MSFNLQAGLYFSGGAISPNNKKKDYNLNFRNKYLSKNISYELLYVINYQQFSFILKLKFNINKKIISSQCQIDQKAIIFAIR